MSDVDYTRFLPRSMQPLAVGGADGSPDSAARALKLGTQLGVPPSIVNSDLEGSEEDARRINASRYSQEPAIAGYIGADPIHAQVSNDDYENLSNVTKAWNAFWGGTGHAFQSLGALPNALGRDKNGNLLPVEKAPYAKEWELKDFLSPLSVAVPKFLYQTGASAPSLGAGALGAVAGGAAAGPVGAFGGAAVLAGAAAFAQSIAPYYQSAIAEGLDPDSALTRAYHQAGLDGAISSVGMAAFAIKPFRGAVKSVLTQALGVQPGVAVAGRLVQNVMAGRPGEEGLSSAAIGGAVGTIANPLLYFGLRGHNAPEGVDPVADQVRAEISKTNVNALDNLMAAAGESKTLERSRQAFEAFAEQHEGQTVSIPAEKIKEIYDAEGARPTYGDHLFGYIPDIEHLLPQALDFGGDINIPLSKYVAFTDEALHAKVREDLKINDGVSLNEAADQEKAAAKSDQVSEGREAPKGTEAYHGSPHDFTAFDIGKVGTGEGAQSYGHGLYFAENPAVASVYRETLAGKHATQGNLYQVRIKADREHFLDWDKPLSEQNPEVLSIIQRLFDEDKLPVRAEKSSRFKAGDLSGLPNELFDLQSPETSRVLREAGIPGIQYLDQQSRVPPKDYVFAIKQWRDDLAAAQKAHAAGEEWNGWSGDKLQAQIASIEQKITGMEAQVESKPTRNFVVFHHKDVEITHKNGVAQGIAEVAAAETKGMGLEPLFADAKAAGMTKGDFSRYTKKIERAFNDLLDRATSAASRDVKKRQTAEWKANEADVRDEVSKNLEYNPTNLVDRYLRTGESPNGFLNPGLKLDSDQVAARFGKEAVDELPKNALKKGGVSPDDLAQVFGFNSGEALINNLRMLENARRTNKESPAEFFNRRVEEETAKTMESRFGDLGENIFNEARDAALADVHMEIMGDELKALAGVADGEPPFTAEKLRSMTKEIFARSDMVNGKDVESFQRAVRKQGLEAERALLKGDTVGAFQAKQKQLVNFLLAQEANKFDRLIDRTEKTLKRFAKEAAIPSVDQAYTNQIRGILNQIGWGSRHPVPPDMAKLSDFVAASDGQLAVAKWLQDGEKVDYEKMTTQQYQEMADSIKSLQHVGREEKLITNTRAKADLDNVIFDVRKQNERFNLVEQPLNKGVKHRVSGWGRWLAAGHILPERMFDYSDKYDHNGPMTAYIDRGLRASMGKEIELNERVIRKFKKMEDFTDASVNDKIENNVIPDQFDRSGFMNITRYNLRQLMLHMGSESNFEKLTKGFGVEEDAVRNLVSKNASENDWKWVQGMWDIFKDLKVEADAMQERVTGVASDTIRAVPVDTGFGWKASGGYAPIVYDRLRSNIESDLAMKGDLFDKNYVQAVTPHSYTISRTGYFGPLDLTGMMLKSKIQGMVHDIAFRESVLNARKLIFNKEFRNIISEKWGKEYADVLQGWLKDIANSHTVDDTYTQGAARVGSMIRQNLVSSLIFQNPGTIMKHGVTALAMSIARVGPFKLGGAMSDIGMKGFARSAKEVFVPKAFQKPDLDFIQALKDVTDPSQIGDQQREFILANSPFMRQRARGSQENIRAAYDRASYSGFGQDFMNWRAASMDFGRSTVSFSDALSAMPTWLAAYKREMLEHGNHADATFVADKEVSRAHGSTSILDQPRFARSKSELGRWFSSLYNFWNHMFNNQLQFAWDVGAKMEGRDEPHANVQSLANRMFWLAVIPIAIEELAAPAVSDDKHGGWLKQIGLSTIRYLGGGIIGAREFTNAVASGYEPSVGMLGTAFKTGYAAVHDASQAVMNKKISKDWFTHLTTALGMATGIGGAQVGRTATGVLNKERANSFTEFRRMIRTGHPRPPKGH